MLLNYLPKKRNLIKNAFPLRVAEPWNSLPNSVMQARSINSFKNHLDIFWSTQAKIYDYESPLTITTGTGIYDIKIFDSEEEDLIMKEPSGFCDQNHHKVRYICMYIGYICIYIYIIPLLPSNPLHIYNIFIYIYYPSFT